MASNDKRCEFLHEKAYAISLMATTNNTLWAPWRLAYVKGDAQDGSEGQPDPTSIAPEAWPLGADPGCFLCRAMAAVGHERALGVLERTALSLVLINRFPYASGHLLVAPLDHRATLEDLRDEQLLDLQRCLTKWCGLARQSLQCQGFNIGLNLGKVAGAGVPGHLHWHLLPRWDGDVNFMPAVAGTQVIPQALSSLWEQLREARDREEVADA
jgi:ATP adenylyltransferase